MQEVQMALDGLDPQERSGGRAARTGRHETRSEQRDRNWNDLLQELRVMQTGTQVIAGFLLTLPFQQRFEKLDQVGVLLYLTLVALANSMILVPVHRNLIGLHVKDHVVTVVLLVPALFVVPRHIWASR